MGSSYAGKTPAVLPAMTEAMFLAKHELLCEVMVNHFTNSSLIYTGLSHTEVKSQLYKQVRQTWPKPSF